ncbi:VTC domain-containing protein, partial [Actinomyces oris]
MTVSTSPAASSAGSQAPTSVPLSADHLAPTSLAELNSAAGLLTRVDRKYLVPLERAQELVGGLTSDARVLDIDGRRRFSYASTYFDTPGLEAFMLTARKRRRRFKVRTRTYLDSGLCFLEVKTRGARGTTVKRRMGYHPDDASRLTGPGRAFVAACL